MLPDGEMLDETEGENDGLADGETLGDSDIETLGLIDCEIEPEGDMLGLTDGDKD